MARYAYAGIDRYTKRPTRVIYISELYDAPVFSPRRVLSFDSDASFEYASSELIHSLGRVIFDFFLLSE